MLALNTCKTQDLSGAPVAGSTSPSRAAQASRAISAASRSIGPCSSRSSLRYCQARPTTGPGLTPSNVIHPRGRVPTLIAPDWDGLGVLHRNVDGEVNGFVPVSSTDW